MTSEQVDAERAVSREAAVEAVDAEHVLVGEDLSSTDLDEARTWVQVYDELLGFKQSVLRSTGSAVERMSEPARREVEETDVRILEAEAQRFDRRLAYWRARCHELEHRVDGPV